jgi:hypothetical protein
MMNPGKPNRVASRLKTVNLTSPSPVASDPHDRIVIAELTLRAGFVGYTASGTVSSTTQNTDVTNASSTFVRILFHLLLFLI